MNRILKVYLKNIFSQKGFYICLLIDLALNVFLVYTLSLFIKEVGETTVAQNIKSILSGGLGLLHIIFISIFVCLDFNEGTTKNYISRGYTRRELFTSKFIASLIAMGAFFLTNSLAVIILYSSNGFGFNTSDFIYILGCIIAIIASTGFFVVICNTLEKLSTSIVVNIVLINTFLPLLFSGINLLLKIDFDISKYWVTGLTNLLPNTPGIFDLLKVSGISLLYLVILFEIGNHIIKRKEIK